MLQREVGDGDLVDESLLRHTALLRGGQQAGGQWSAGNKTALRLGINLKIWFCNKKAADELADL